MHAASSSAPPIAGSAASTAPEVISKLIAARGYVYWQKCKFDAENVPKITFQQAVFMKFVDVVTIFVECSTNIVDKCLFFYIQLAS
jgi:hypothetical protein